MFRWRNLIRGIPTQDGIYCPRQDKTFSSEEDLGPRQYRNRQIIPNYLCNTGRGKMMGRGRGRGHGRGLGRRWGFWPWD